MSETTEIMARLSRLEHENLILQDKVARLEQRLADVGPLVEEVKQLHFWDFSVYEVTPDASWLAIDRAQTSMLLAALAHVDHWKPWKNSIEPRPQP